MKLELKDSRRLTGANLFWDRPSAIIDVAIDGPQLGVIRAWEKAARDWLDAVAYSDQKTCFRQNDISVFAGFCNMSVYKDNQVKQVCVFIILCSEGVDPVRSAAGSYERVASPCYKGLNRVCIFFKRTVFQNHTVSDLLWKVC